jgi:UDP-N-acetyl-2-amino-2-deoxyglucuronate dehydrogenase
VDHAITLGIVGAGDIVSKVHLPALLAMDDVRVTWITDSSAERALSVGAAFGVKPVRLPEDPADLPKSDVALLAIPYGAREPYYRAFAQSDLAVYAEKPFALSRAEHEAICEPFSDHRLACGFMRRSWGPNLAMKDAAETTLFGRLRSIKFGYGRRGAVGGGSFRANLKLSGGGMLFESAIHGIDSLLYVSGAVDVKVEDPVMIADNGFDLHTTARLIVRNAAGEQVDGEITVSCLEDTSQRFECVFERATASYSLFTESEVELRPRGSSNVYKLAGMYPMANYQTAFENWRRFLEGLETGEANWTSARRSLLTTAVIEELYKASR